MMQVILQIMVKTIETNTSWTAPPPGWTGIQIHREWILHHFVICSTEKLSKHYGSRLDTTLSLQRYLLQLRKPANFRLDRSTRWDMESDA